MFESTKIPEPTLSHYLPPQQDELSFFPNLPPLVGHGNYSANSYQPKPNVDECRKYSESHPVLTPGIFTIYCEH